MIEREDRNTVSTGDTELRLQRTGGRGDAIDQVGEVHLSLTRWGRVGERSEPGWGLRASSAPPVFALRAKPPSPCGGGIKKLTHPSRPARRVSLCRGDPDKSPPSTAASASRSGCRDRCAPAAGS